MRNLNNTMKFNYNNFDGITETYISRAELLMRCTTASETFEIAGRLYEIMYIYVSNDNIYECYITNVNLKRFMLRQEDFDFLNANMDELIDICKNHKFERK